MGQLAYVTTHTQVALSRLLEQFKGKPNLQAIVTILGNRSQELEDGFWTLVTNRLLAGAQGVNLDLLGRIVGQPRLGTADQVYALYIAVRILINRSSGTVPEIYRIFSILWPSPGTLGIVQYQPACFMLTLGNGTISDSQAAVFGLFLTAIKAGGVRTFLQYTSSTNGNVFTLGTTAFLETSELAGVGFLTSSVSFAFLGWPQAGSVILDQGTATEETVAYDYNSGTVLDLVGVTAYPHDANTSITLVGGPGKGFGDTGNPATGGQLASIIEV